jgi:hypothetical protein
MHPIFQQHPLQDKKVATSAGQQPTPYHVYAGQALMIGGTADYARVSALLAGEQVTPAKTQAGRALMAFWAVDETSASHGAHSEMQISLYVSHRPTAPVKDSPFAPLHFILADAQARQMCHGLWNNTPEVVTYNAEILGLKPKLARSQFTYSKDRFAFSFHDAASGALLAQGDVRQARQSTLGATAALFGAFGLRLALRAASMKVIEVQVVNPISAHLPRNADARTLSHSAKIVAQLFDTKHDHLTLTDGVYSQLDFRPTFIEHMRGFQLVYLNPQ